MNARCLWLSGGNVQWEIVNVEVGVLDTIQVAVWGVISIQVRQFWATGRRASLHKQEMWARKLLKKMMSQKLKKGIKKTIPFTIASNPKYIGIHLTKDVHWKL